MAVIATAELTVDSPLERAFQQFNDFSSWDLWMPPMLRPISGPSRELREGDRVCVAFVNGRARVRTDLTVIRMRPNRELCWRAGVPGVLVGEHSFFFREQAGRTLVRSEEPFAGLLAIAPLARPLERAATAFGAKVLEHFAAFLRQKRSVP
jgi:hypothetical protein